ncbi:MAG: hypothetical protein PVSMB7_25040 [Chloroflexota bacterium]
MCGGLTKECPGEPVADMLLPVDEADSFTNVFALWGMPSDRTGRAAYTIQPPRSQNIANAP